MESADGVTQVADAIVIGGGLTGLACAHELKRRGHSVHLIEASAKVGGVVGTFETGGFLFEAGPNTVPSTAQNVRELSAELGVADQLVTSRPEAARRYLFKDGGLHELPSSPGALLRTGLLSRKGRMRVLTEPLRRFDPETYGGAEPTFEQFLTERIGPEATRTFAGAFVRGVYAAEIDELGARSAFPRVWKMASEHGGLVRGMVARMREKKRARKAGVPLPPGPRTRGGDLLSFSGGFGVLVNAFESALAGHVSRNTQIAEIERGPGGWRAVLETGEALACRELVLAVPGSAALPLLSMCAPSRLDLGALKAVEHAAVTSVHLGLENAPLPPGFGFLVPPDEERRGDPRTPGVLGMLFVSNLFHGRAPSGTSSITAMFRGGEVADLVGDTLVDAGVLALEKALVGYEATHPGAPRRTRAPRVVASRTRRWTGVIPRYAPGHIERFELLRRSSERILPGLHLAGNYVGGVSVDDRLGHGRNVAAQVSERLAHLTELREDHAAKRGRFAGSDGGDVQEAR
ncbi:MAG: protoporphyrinogen oxidase [Planctomycetota bacterium]